MRGEKAPPNQLVELKEVAFEVFLEIVGRQTYFGGPNGLVCILHLRAPAPFVDVRLVGQIALVELRVDVLARLLDRGVGHTNGIGTHIGDQTYRSLIPNLYSLIQLLGGAHRTAG